MWLKYYVINCCLLSVSCSLIDNAIRRLITDIASSFSSSRFLRDWFISSSYIPCFIYPHLVWVKSGIWRRVRLDSILQNISALSESFALICRPGISDKIFGIISTTKIWYWLLQIFKSLASGKETYMYEEQIKGHNSSDMTYTNNYRGIHLQRQSFNYNRSGW